MSDEVPECRICFEPEMSDDLFISPCRCSGTSKYVHQSCLHNWRYINRNEIAFTKCMECHENYRIIKNYPVEPTNLCLKSSKISNIYYLKYLIAVPSTFFIIMCEYYSLNT